MACDANTKQRNDEPPDSDLSTLSAQILSLMERNLNFPLSLDELADELGVSRRTLSRFCKSMLGDVPMPLYLRVRLHAARNFLFYEDFSIKDVAIACGFSYPSVFFPGLQGAVRPERRASFAPFFASGKVWPCDRR